MRLTELRRIGVVGPAGNMALEWELPRHLPEGFAISHARAVRPGGTTLTAASLGEMGRNAIAAARSLIRTRPELILYACTSGSFVDGPGSEDAVAEAISEATGVPALTASRAVLEALAALKAQRVFLLTPYPDDINRAEIAFLQAAGHEVTGCVAHPCGEHRPIGNVDSRDTVALLMEHAEAASDSDAVFISCTNLLSFDIIPELETRLGRPVMSSNLALLRAALVQTGAPLPLTGPGALMRIAPDAATAFKTPERIER